MTSGLKPLGSSLTTPASNENTSITKPAGSHGSSDLTASSPSGRMIQTDRVTDRAPAVNMEAAVSQLQECGLSLKQEVTGSLFPKGGGFEPVVEIRMSSLDECDWDRVRSIVNGLMAPAHTDKIMEWLTVLAMETASKDEGEAASQLRLRILSDRLQEFPGDVVRAVIRQWPEQNTFFPTAWKELRAALIQRMGNRGAIANKLRVAIGQRSAKGLDDLPGGIDPDKYLKRILRLAEQKIAITKGENQ